VNWPVKVSDAMISAGMAELDQLQEVAIASDQLVLRVFEAMVEASVPEIPTFKTFDEFSEWAVKTFPQPVVWPIHTLLKQDSPK
jgi:hypothetical protein